MTVRCRSYWLIVATAFFGLALSGHVHADDGVWGVDADGDWTLDTNWESDIIADGADFTATFGNIITANRVVTLGANRTIGNITASDTSHSYTISGADILTLDVATGLPTLDVTTSGRELAISSQVSGNDGLQKIGAGNLRLTGTNDYTGGTTIGGGRLIVGSDAALGATSGGITFTGTQGTLLLPTGTFTLDSGRTITAGTGAMAVIARENINNNGVIDIGGQLTGDGGFQFSNGYQLGSVTFNASNANNNFQGVLRLGGDYSGALQFTPSTVTFNIGSLADGVGYGNVQFGRGNNSSGNTLTVNYTNAATADLVLNNRQIELANNSEGGQITNSNTTFGIIINTDLVVSRAGNKSLTLNAASGSVNNVFAGDLADGTDATISLTKTGAGTWALGGTNTYSGITNLAASGTTGRLIFQGAQALSPNTTLAFNQNSSSVQSISLLDDGVGTIDFARPITFDGANTTQVMNIFVGNNNTANGGSSSGTTTGSTIQVGEITWEDANQAGNNIRTFNVTGANDYSLETGAFTLPNAFTRTAGATWTNAMNPTTASLTVASFGMEAGNQKKGVPVLQLGGTAAGNQVLGAIADAPDVGPGPTDAYELRVTKAGANDWTLFGVNTYTGNTTVSGGTLEIGGSGSLGSGSYAGAIAIASTNNGTLRFNSTAAQTVSGVVSGAGALVKDNTGILTLTELNTLSGPVAVNGGVLSIASTGSINDVSGITLAGGTLNYSSSVALTAPLTITSGTISGNGTINQDLTINGSIAPGNSIGVLTVGGNVTWNGDDATPWVFELDAGDSADLLDIANGDFLIGSGTGGTDFVFDFAGSTAAGAFDLVTWTGSTTFSESDFSYTNYAGSNPGAFVINGSTLQFVAVPEPAAMALASLGLAGIAAAIRRARWKA